MVQWSTIDYRNYGKNIIIFPPVPFINGTDIISLFEVLGYYQKRELKEIGNKIYYELVPKNRGNYTVFLSLTGGRIEFHYNSLKEKKKIKDMLLEVEQNIESLLRINGE